MTLPTRQNYAPSSYFEIKIDGQFEKQAMVKNVEGGMVKANIAEEITGGSPTPIKHTTSREQEPITIEAAMSGTGLLWKWIQKSWKKEYARYNGAIIHGDVFDKSVTYQEFFNALVEEVTFPALDANSKDLCHLKIKIRPEYSTLKFENGHTLDKTMSPRQKAWESAAFRLHIEGVDTDDVNKVDSFTVKQKIKPVACGAFHGSMSLPQLEPVGMVFPNLKVEMPLSSAGEMLAWYQLMRNGKKDTDIEKEGRLEFLDSTRNKVLGHINLHNVGINAMNVGKSQAKEDAVKRATFELYVGSMDIGSTSGEFWAPIG